MPIWNRIVDEFERAGRAANSAIDEGKLRLTLLKARQKADRAAQRLGYAVFKAKTDGAELPPDDYNRHASELAAAQAEIARLETLIREAAAGRATSKPASAESTPEPAEPTVGRDPS